MATVMFAEILDNLQHSTWHNPESLDLTLDTNRKNTQWWHWDWQLGFVLPRCIPTEAVSARHSTLSIIKTNYFRRAISVVSAAAH
jgi:hypothetical protein